MKLQATEVFWNTKHNNKSTPYCFSNFKEHDLLILLKGKKPLEK